MPDLSRWCYTAEQVSGGTVDGWDPRSRQAWRAWWACSSEVGHWVVSRGGDEGPWAKAEQAQQWTRSEAGSLAEVDMPEFRLVMRCGGLGRRRGRSRLKTTGRHCHLASRATGEQNQEKGPRRAGSGSSTHPGTTLKHWRTTRATALFGPTAGKLSNCVKPGSGTRKRIERYNLNQPDLNPHVGSRYGPDDDTLQRAGDEEGASACAAGIQLPVHAQFTSTE
ncbi:hypothetical protein V8F20_003713 [Naviculisporaceae sp. PSN 640]